MSQPNITPFTIDNTNILYYNNKDLKILKPHFFYGFQSDPKHIIERKNIPESDYVFTCFNKKKGWSIYDNTCKRAQLLIKKSWVDKFFFNQNDILSNHILSNDNQEDDDEEKNQNIQQSIDLAPNILDLDDDEKFKDIDGNIIDIETRGQRNADNIFFKVQDISVVFEMPNLDAVLLHTDKGYDRDIDYKTFFIRVKLTNGQSQTIKKSLYLTYQGILRVLFVSRNKNATNFRKWATNKLFTCQMGSNGEKKQLVADLMNTDVKSVDMMFDDKIFSFPCIYLLSLGFVKNLRETFGINEDVDGELIVYKFGRTNDFSRRKIEHKNYYGKMKNVKLNLEKIYFIDIKYLTDAENSVNQLCTNFSKKLLLENYRELVALNNAEVEEIKKYYKMLGELYIGATAGLQKEITDLKNELLLKDCKIESLEKDNKLLQKDNEILQKNMDYNIIQNKYELLLKQNELDSFKRERVL